MKKSYLKQLILFSTFIIAMWGCENDYPDSIYNPNETFKPNPTISTVSPDVAFAGVDTISITGQNFSSNASDVEVYFNGVKGETISTTSGLVKVIPPNVIGDSVKIQLRVAGALKYAELKPYKLEPITIEYGVFDKHDNAYGIACDLNENIYVSLFGNKLIQKITPDLERHDYVKILRDKTTQMKFGPDGYLYYVFGLKFMLRILPDGSKDELFAILPGNAYDLDFDENLNIYSGGSGSAVYKTTPDKHSSVVKEYPDTYIHALRVYNGYLYVAGSYSGSDANHVVEGVWRNQILTDVDSLGATELVLDLESKMVGKEIKSMVISEDGNIYLGTTGDEGIYVIKTDGSFSPLYAGVLKPDINYNLPMEIYAMTWGNGEFLYVTRKGQVKNPNTNEEIDPNRILRINMRKKTAPYYGRR